MLFALFGVVAFAQSASPVFKGIDRHALPAHQATISEDVDLVTPPATAQVETWYTIDGMCLVNTPMGAQDFTSVMSTITVAIDGSDIYIQGLAYYFKDNVEECAKWTKVGIQSIYYGGDECNKSAIAWIVNPNASGISNIWADGGADKAVIYNMAGQRMAAPQKGLNIINGRKVIVK